MISSPVDPFERSLMELIESIDAMFVDQVALICGIGNYGNQQRTSDDIILLRMRHDHVTLRDRIVDVVKQLENELQSKTADGDNASDGNNGDKKDGFKQYNGGNGRICTDISTNSSPGDSGPTEWILMDEIRNLRRLGSDSHFNDRVSYGNGLQDNKHVHGDDQLIKKDAFGIEDTHTILKRDIHQSKHNVNPIPEKGKGPKAVNCNSCNVEVVAKESIRLLEQKNRHNDEDKACGSKRRGNTLGVAGHDSQDESSAINDKGTLGSIQCAFSNDQDLPQNDSDTFQDTLIESREIKSDSEKENYDDYGDCFGDEEGEKSHCYNWSTGDLDGYLLVDEEMSIHMVEESTVDTPNCLLFSEPAQTYTRLNSWWKLLDLQNPFGRKQRDSTSWRSKRNQNKNKWISSRNQMKCADCTAENNAQWKMSLFSQDNDMTSEDERSSSINRKVSVTSLSSVESNFNNTRFVFKHHYDQQQFNPGLMQNSHQDKNQQKFPLQTSSASTNSTEDLLEDLLADIDQFNIQLETMFTN